jgi:hypothetical protein
MAEQVTDATQKRDDARVNGRFGVQPAHLPEESVHLVAESKLTKREAIVASANDKAQALVKRGPEAALALFLALGESLGAAEFKPLRLVNVRDDGETYRGVRCPHCKTLIDESDLTAVDWSIYNTQVDDLDADDGSITIRRSYDDDSGYAPLYFTAECCDRPVSLGELREYR